MTCLDAAGLAEQKVDRILTQYRESPNLLAIIRHDLLEIANIMVVANGVRASMADVVSDDYNVLNDALQLVVGDPNCPPSEGMLGRFDILTATGDQLTIIGKILGFPRCHCVCFTVPKFGFSCNNILINILSDDNFVLSDGDQVIISQSQAGASSEVVGFCEGGFFSGCNLGGFGEICIDDDEVYRRLLLARRYQARQLWDIASLQAAANQIWGPQAAVINMGGARVGIAPGRELNQVEQMMLPIAMRILPIAPGIEKYISLPPGRVFGFGGGWGGMCEEAQWFCPEVYVEDCD